MFLCHQFIVFNNEQTNNISSRTYTSYFFFALLFILFSSVHFSSDTSFTVCKFHWRYRHSLWDALFDAFRNSCYVNWNVNIGSFQTRHISKSISPSARIRLIWFVCVFLCVKMRICANTSLLWRFVDANKSNAIECEYKYINAYKVQYKYSWAFSMKKKSSEQREKEKNEYIMKTKMKKSSK